MLDMPSNKTAGVNIGIGTSIIRIGFWGPLNYTFNKEPPKILLVIIQAPILTPTIDHNKGLCKLFEILEEGTVTASRRSFRTTSFTP